eukprot:gene1669-438_t
MEVNELTLNQLFESIDVLNGSLEDEIKTEKFLNLLSQNNKISKLKLLNFPAHGIEKLSNILIYENQNITDLELLYLQNLQQEEVDSLNKMFIKNKRIEKLSLISMINITDANLFLENLTKNSTIKTLNLTENILTSESGELLCELLKNNKTITNLDLTFTLLSDKGIEKISTALETNTTLKVLNLSENDINSSGFCHLGASLMKNETLEELGLDGNYLTGNGRKALFEYLRGTKSLKKLSIARTLVLQKYGGIFLSKMIASNKSVLYLDLSFNDLNLQDAKSLGNGIKENGNLETLILDRCQIGNQSVSSVCEAVLICKSIKSLSLERNHFTSQGIKIISKMIERTKSLTSLNVSGHNPGGSLKYFFESLKSNQTITELHIDDISLSEHPCGFRWVYEYFKDKKYKILEIGHNGFHSKSFTYVAKLIKFNPFIEHLIFRNEQLTDGMLRLLSESMKQNHTIKYLNMKLDLGVELVSNIGRDCILEFMRESKALEELILTQNVDKKFIFLMNSLLDRNLERKREKNLSKLSSTLVDISFRFEKNC